MIFLSQLILNPKNTDVRRDLSDVQEMHRSVMRIFPQAGAGAAREHYGVLFRTDIHRDGTPCMLIQSTEPPDWSRQSPNYVRALPVTKCIDEPYATLKSGQQLLFRLRANPTRRLTVEGRTHDRPKGKRVDIRGEEQQLEWLRRKGKDGGFELLEARAGTGVPAVDARPGGMAVGHRRDRERNRKLSFGSVLFEGVLRVTDADLFRRTLVTGLGSGKAYGFGLLSVAPVRSSSPSL